MFATFAPRLIHSRVMFAFLVACFLISAFLTELLPFVFGTGSAAIVDWSWFYVTFRFVVLPLASVFLLVWGVQQLRLGLRLRQATILWQASFGLAVASAFVGLSVAVPLPWLWLAVHGLDGPQNVPGWLQ